MGKIRKVITICSLVGIVAGTGLCQYSLQKAPDFPQEYRTLMLEKSQLEENIDHSVVFKAKDIGEQAPSFRKSVNKYSNLVSKLRETNEQLIELEEDQNLNREDYWTLVNYYDIGNYTRVSSFAYLFFAGIGKYVFWRERRKNKKQENQNEPD